MAEPRLSRYTRGFVSAALLAGCSGAVDVDRVTRSGASGPETARPTYAPTLTPAGSAMGIPLASIFDSAPLRSIAPVTVAELDDRETSCETLAQEAQATLTRSCAACHADGHRDGGFAAVLDVPAMISQGKLVPRDRDASTIYVMVATGLMPRGAARLDAATTESLGAWIECGAPDFRTPEPDDAVLGFVDIDARLGAMNDDLLGESDDDRDRIRYIDFSNLSNAGASEREIANYKNAVVFLLNSLSTEDELVVPEQVGPGQLLMRIDRRAFGWSREIWEALIADYPYAVRYGQSRRFDHDEETAQRLRDTTQTAVPFVYADWFLAHASRPPLYYQLLGIPADLNELTAQLGIDLAGDIDDSRVLRAGFNGSGISAQNRVIERHDNPDSDGAFWLSYDFKSNLDEQNIFAHPIDFQQDGGEGIYHLPNGLQAYFLADAVLGRIDKAPTEIVTDPNTKDRAVEAGLSCMGGCHLGRGIIVKDDAVRGYVRETPIDDFVRERTLELYPEVSVMRDRIASDNERYLDALARTGFDPSDEQALHKLVRTHEDLVDLAGVAAVLGVPEDALRAALEDDPGDFPLEIVALRRVGGSIYRDVLEDRFGEIVSALGLGELQGSE